MTITRVDTGLGTYVELDIAQRRTIHIDRGGRLVPVDVEASVGVYTGPAGHRARFFDADALAELAWTLLTLSHQLRRLQGPPAAPEPDPQISIFDALNGAHA